MRIDWILVGICSWQLASLANGEDFSRSAAVEVSRVHQAWLSEAENCLEAGEMDFALDRLQSLLDSDQALIPRGEAAYENSQSAARRMLESLPAEGLARYEEKFGGIARAKLLAARETHDFTAICKVAEQYPLTKAGYEALRTSAAWLFDQGEFLAAAAAYQAISEHPFTQPNMRPADVMRWAVALSRLGMTEEAGQVTKRYRNELRKFENQFQMMGVAEVDRREPPGTIKLGASLRSDPSHPLVLPSSEVLWEHAASLPDAAEGLLREVQEQLAQRGFSPLANSSPVVAGDLVIARSLNGVTAYDRTTGMIRWRMPLESYSVELAQNPHLTENPKLRETISGQLAAFALADRNAGSLTSDGRRVFLTLTDRVSDPLAKKAPAQLLALDNQTGQELWRFPTQGTGDNSIDPEHDLFLFGPPTPLGSSLYLIGEQNHEIRLVVLSPKTGSIQWSVSLGMTGWPVSKDRIRLRWACPVVYSGGLLLCPTGAGAMAAVDPHLRSCRWVCRYARKDFPLPNPNDWLLGMGSQNERPDDWWTGGRDVCLVVHQETAVLLSPESHRLHAVSLPSGKPLWTLPRGDGLFLSPAIGHRILLVGSQSVRFINLDQGKIEKTLSTPKPGGRGVRVSHSDGPKYLLPLAAGGVCAIDLISQTPERTFPAFPMPGGNLVIDGETILMQTHDRVLRLAPWKGEPQSP